MSRFGGLSMFAVVAVVMLASTGTVMAKPTAGHQPGWLGVALQDVTEDVRDALPRNVREGAMINEVVEGSPADEAGLEEGDVITRFDGEAISNASDLTKAVRDASADETVDIEFYREGRLMRERVTLSDRDDDTPESDVTRPRSRRFEWRDDRPNAPHPPTPPRTPRMFQFQEFHGTYLGVHLMDLNDQLAQYFGADEDGGALVTEVVDDSPASEAGVKAGDVITQIGDEEVSDVDDIRDALQDYDEGESVQVHVLRKGQPLTLTAKVDKREGMQGLRRGMMFETPAPGESFSWNAEPFRQQFGPEFRENFRKEMDELKRELEDLREELSDLKSNRP